jgi:hypothetical protein
MAPTARGLAAKDTNEKLAHRRLTVLEPAERLGNVSGACRRGGIDRTSFCDGMNAQALIASSSKGWTG